MRVGCPSHRPFVDTKWFVFAGWILGIKNCGPHLCCIQHRYSRRCSPKSEAISNPKNCLMQPEKRLNGTHETWACQAQTLLWASYKNPEMTYADVVCTQLGAYFLAKFQARACNTLALSDASTAAGCMAASTHGGTDCYVAVVGGAWSGERGAAAATAAAAAHRRGATPTGGVVTPPRSAPTRGGRGG